MFFLWKKINDPKTWCCVLYFVFFVAYKSYGDTVPLNATPNTSPVPSSVQSGLKISDQKEERKKDRELIEHAEEIQEASSRSVRKFHEVLESLLTEFSYDVQSGQLKNINNLSLRKVEVSNALPKTYKKYVKLLVSEKIRENSDIKLINCIPCESKTSKIVQGNLVITSPASNLTALKEAAHQLSINYFMDVVFIYHSTHMIFAVQVFDVSSNELVWSRAYNSETIRSRYQKLAIDYNQVMESRKSDTYTPQYHLMIGLGGGSLPNIGGTSEDSRMLALETRSTEKFDNRNFEFGLLFTIYARLNSFVGVYPTTGTASSSATKSTTSPKIEPVPFDYAGSIHALFARNFLGEVESYDRIRVGLNCSLGAFITSGFFTGQTRFGLDLYFGRRFVVNIAGSYLLPMAIKFQSTTETQTKGGFGGQSVISFNF